MGQVIDLDKISIKEKIELIDTLWLSVLSEEEKIESPEWHKDILEQRMQKIKDGTAEFILIEDLKKV